ncbi:MAG TPA: hypothetical protein PK725_12975 [Rhodocyclaceae bacterium]|jgi:hypothetical protein|nr:hypothetical protein [Rhodocyclaceae bacterium]HRQ47857.1 hypothetical protein [Rhodocyclaceae bacterium]
MKCLVPLASLALLTACATPPPEPTAGIVETVAPVEGLVAVDGQLMLDLDSGVYHCEFGAHVDVVRENGTGIGNGARISIGWNGGRYQLERDPSSSGLPRFEDRANGLVWIDLPWKGVLLDGKTQKPLANECKTA